MNNALKNSKIFPWIIWGLTAIFYFYTFLLQVSPSVMVHDLMSSFSVHATAISNFASIYFFIYMIMQIPVGILFDRFSARWLLTLAAALCGIGCVIFAASHSFSAAVFSRALIGLGSSFAVVGSFNVASLWFSPKRFAAITGLTVTIGMFGAVSGESPLALMINHFGWRTSMNIFAVIGIAFSILMWLIVRNPNAQTKPHHAKTSILTGLKYTLTSKQSWLAALFGGFLYAPTPIFGALWGVPFLMHAHNISKPIAAAIISSIFFGWMFGSPFFGWVSDFLARRKPPMIISAIGGLITLTSVIYIQNLSNYTLAILLFAFGFLSSGFILAFAVVKEINPARYSATSIGFTNMLNMFWCATLQPVIGIVLDLLWQGKMKHDVRIYNIVNYHLALSILPLLILCSIVLLPFIKETFCRPVDFT
ncbi:MAG: MFS transporter [Gammaproteobacteria bacterium]|jgi:MFS family permease